MRVLVTGGSGFLGREVLKNLSENGVDARSFSRRAAYDPALSSVEAFAGSVLDETDCRRALEGCDGLIHLAGKVSRHKRDASELMRLHVDGTRNMLQAAVNAGVSRVVYLSTSGTIAVSKDVEEVKNEAADYPLERVRRWPYYLSKIYAEQEALRFFREEQLPVICLNPTLLLGPGDKDRSSTEDVRRFLDGLMPAVPAGGMSFVDVRDVAATVTRALSKGRPGERYLLTAENLPTEAFFKRLARMSGRSAPLITLPKVVTRWSAKLLGGLEAMTNAALMVNEIDLEMGRHGWYADNKKARLELEFDPREPNQTLRDTITWLREWVDPDEED